MKHQQYLIQIIMDNFYKFIDKKDEKNKLGESYWLKLPDNPLFTKEEYKNILFICDDYENLQDKIYDLKKRCGLEEHNSD